MQNFSIILDNNCICFPQLRNIEIKLQISNIRVQLYKARKIRNKKVLISLYIFYILKTCGPNCVCIYAPYRNEKQIKQKYYIL